MYYLMFHTQIVNNYLYTYIHLFIDRLLNNKYAVRWVISPGTHINALRNMCWTNEYILRIYASYFHSDRSYNSQRIISVLTRM